MIVSFSVSNFRSFSSEETFSLLASNRISGAHEDHTFSIPNSKEKVLKTAVIYGANGAGKSNLFKALLYLKSIALKTRHKNSGTRREKFCFGSGMDEPSEFDILFITENKLYRYGVKVDDQRIIEEWLIHVVGGREKPIYERKTDDNGEVIIEISIKNPRKKLKALVTVGSPQNQSFLATALATLDTSDLGDELGNVIDWFDNNLKFIAPDTLYGALSHLLDSNSDFLEFAGNFLKYTSTGVDSLKINKKEITENELSSFFPKEIFSKILEDLAKNENKSRLAVMASKGRDLLIERTDENHYYLTTIHAAHENQVGDVINLDIKDESDGTRRLLNLLPALFFLKKRNAVFFIDEIDRSMHPILAFAFLESFLNSCQDGKHQIIVTTHESNLLDLELLRRDEIWFTEKDQTGSTRLYSLADFKARNNFEVRKHYLQGRFGAIPFLGNINCLLSEKDNQDESPKT
jgi:AAA15 family ATPase/GTPase